MTWTALVPLKGSIGRKSRLASRLSPDERWRLVDNMFEHVAAVLRMVPEIGRMIVLSESRPAGWREDWAADRGRGLNQELESVRATLPDVKLLMINADLPFLQPSEVSTLLASAKTGCAIAPDRHGIGTNALALDHLPSFRLSFGAGSFSSHAVENGGMCAIVRQFGLAFDVDTPDDYESAIAAGMKTPAER